MRPILLGLAFCAAAPAFAEDITINNVLRAETDTMFRFTMQTYDIGVGELFHVRETAAADKPQPIIRANQDTLYSAVIVDLSEPLTATLPEAGDRFQSVLVISQDHYNFGYATPGSYELTEEEVGSRFAMLLFRTFVDVSDPDDLERAHAAQDGIALQGGGSGPFEAPDWDLETLEQARTLLSELAAVVGVDSLSSFGRREDLNPLNHLLGGMSGWGGQPGATAQAFVDAVEMNDGETPYAVTVQDVPVDAFWSITVYNEEGFLEPNDLGRNSYNNTSATSNDDGSYTIHFGACEDGRINCVPITPGWNYTVRLYQPRAEILDGSWTFPDFERL